MGALRVWTNPFSPFNPQIYDMNTNLKKSYSRLLALYAKRVATSPSLATLVKEGYVKTVPHVNGTQGPRVPSAKISTRYPINVNYKQTSSSESKSIDSLDARMVNGKKDYFSGAQKRRIRAMIKDGIKPEKAKSIERQRCAKLMQKKSIAPEIIKPKESISDIVDEEIPKKKESKLVSFATELTIPNSVQLSELPSTSKNCTGNSLEVAITHSMHPTETLTENQMERIKACLLDEVDKSPSLKCNLGFNNISTKGGWLSLTCNNFETKNWLLMTVNRIKPFPQTTIKFLQGNDIPKLSNCFTFIKAEDLLPYDALLLRLEKQNAGLNTAGWHIKKTRKEKSGGRTLVISVDEKSKERILAQNGKLFLNFSKISVYFYKRNDKSSESIASSSLASKISKPEKVIAVNQIGTQQKSTKPVEKVIEKPKFEKFADQFNYKYADQVPTPKRSRASSPATSLFKKVYPVPRRTSVNPAKVTSSKKVKVNYVKPPEVTKKNNKKRKETK